MQEFFPDLSIVLPAYKECENLATLIPDIEKEFQDIPFEIIVVDDNSQDGTAELIGGFKQQFGNITLIERPGLLGLGSALRDGYHAARARYILSSDADLSFRSADMRRLYRKIQEDYDMVLGYKVMPQGIPMPAKHHISMMCNWIIRRIGGIPYLKDFNTNFRIFKTSLWQQLETRENSNFFLFEMIFKAKQKGARITTIPVTFYDRSFGTTKLNFFTEAPRYLLKLIRYTIFVK